MVTTSISATENNAERSDDVDILLTPVVTRHAMLLLLCLLVPLAPFAVLSQKTWFPFRKKLLKSRKFYCTIGVLCRALYYQNCSAKENLVDCRWLHDINVQAMILFI